LLLFQSFFGLVHCAPFCGQKSFVSILQSASSAVKIPSNRFVTESFCLSVPGLVSAANALLKVESHKPPQGCHKPKQGHTRLNKAIQGSKKNLNTSLVYKPSCPLFSIQIANLNSKMKKALMPPHKPKNSRPHLGL
jgi:hypothetical protein